MTDTATSSTVGKVYRGYSAGTPAPGLVTVQVLDGPEQPLRHHPHHSPDGFNWGYGGSGPGELARCVLLDHYNLPGDDGRRSATAMPVSYMDFKFDVVATWPQGEPWTITSEQIDQWAATKLEAAHER